MFDFTGDITVASWKRKCRCWATTFFLINDAAIELHRDRMIPRHFDPHPAMWLIFRYLYGRRATRSWSIPSNHAPRNREMFDNALFPWMDNFFTLGVAPEDIDYVCAPICT